MSGQVLSFCAPIRYAFQTNAIRRDRISLFHGLLYTRMIYLSNNWDELLSKVREPALYTKKCDGKPCLPNIRITGGFYVVFFKAIYRPDILVRE